jgi:hypothetical protein
MQKRNDGMKKVVIVIILLIFGLGGYLGWDWYDKTKRQRLEPSVMLYYWTDSKGGKHISDVPPPKGARNVRTEKGWRHIRTPLIVSIKNKAAGIYKRAKRSLFKSREKPKNK